MQCVLFGNLHSYSETFHDALNWRLLGAAKETGKRPWPITSIWAMSTLCWSLPFPSLPRGQTTQVASATRETEKPLITISHKGKGDLSDVGNAGLVLTNLRSTSPSLLGFDSRVPKQYSGAAILRPHWSGELNDFRGVITSP